MSSIILPHHVEVRDFSFDNLHNRRISHCLWVPHLVTVEIFLFPAPLLSYCSASLLDLLFNTFFFYLSFVLLSSLSQNIVHVMGS
jgi:hypothetical protein